VTHFQPDEGAILGGCGVPIPNTIAKIIDIDTGKALGPNEVSFLKLGLWVIRITVNFNKIIEMSILLNLRHELLIFRMESCVLPVLK